MDDSSRRRKVAAITGSRSDYGLMRPVFAAIAAAPRLELALIVTGLHLLPEFAASLAEIRGDGFGPLRTASMTLAEDSGRAMAQSLGLGVFGIAAALEAEAPDLVLLQGDRGEMLAAAIAAAHMNLPIVHMSGGDRTGSIDDTLRAAIAKFAHVHLTSCADSTAGLRAQGEAAWRIREVGEPALDAIRTMAFIPPAVLAAELDLDLDRPIVVATQHPVTTEAGQAAWQIGETLAALDDLGLQTVFTAPNADAGGRAMAQVLDSFAGRPFLRLRAHLGAERYLSLLRIAAVMVGNSSSGIVEAPSFRLPVVNIGTRQHRRTRANNVVDAGHDRAAIAAAVRFCLTDPEFRQALAECRNPYGDGHAAERTVEILTRLHLTPALIAKWLDAAEAGPLLAGETDEV